jgi:hypothetical protein
MFEKHCCRSLQYTVYIRYEVYGLDSSGSGQEPVADCCEHCNDFLVSIRDQKFLGQSLNVSDNGAL